jgi:hypothetical protein
MLIGATRRREGDMRNICSATCGTLVVGLLSSTIAAGCATLPYPDEMTALVRADVAVDAERRSLGRESLTLTRSDLAFANVSSPFDAIIKLRPYFLLGSTRGPSFGPPEIALYVDNVYDGVGIESVNTIPMEAIQEIRFLHPTEARFRFGTTCRCAAGAIVITTLRAKR